MSVPVTHLILLLLIGCKAIAWAQDFNAIAEEEREKRAIDIGFFVRNLLLKSAAASNVKSDIVRNVINVKTSTAAPRRRTTTRATTTTTTTVAPPLFFNKGPFKFPFDLSAPFNNKFNNNGGYINFDYNDYGARQPQRPGRRRRPTSTATPTTSTTTTSTTRAPAQPTRRRPIPRRPYGLFGKQKRPQFEYYNDDDYNYNYYDDDDVDDNSATTANPPTTRRPPPPPSSRPQRPPTAARARAQGRVPQLRNRLVYEFRQPDDTSTNNKQPPTPVDDDSDTSNDPQTNNDSENNDDNVNQNENNEETSQNANDYSDVNDNENASDNGDVNNNSNNNEQDTDDANNDTNNASDDNNNNNSNSNPDDYTYNLPLPPLQPPQHNQFNVDGNFAYNFGNFGPSAGFQYPAFNDYGTQYQPSAPTDYSVRFY